MLLGKGWCLQRHPQQVEVLEPTSTAVGSRTAVREPTAANIGLKVFCLFGHATRHALTIYTIAACPTSPGKVTDDRSVPVCWILGVMASGLQEPRPQTSTHLQKPLNWVFGSASKASANCDSIIRNLRLVTKLRHHDVIGNGPEDSLYFSQVCVLVCE